MKRVRYSLVWLAARVMVASAAPVPSGMDESSASFYQELLTYSASSITSAAKPEPEMTLGARHHMTGLLVDLLHPKETWNMLDPSVPSRKQPAPDAPSSQSVTLPMRMNDPAVHEADFVLLRVSFP